MNPFLNDNGFLYFGEMTPELIRESLDKTLSNAKTILEVIETATSFSWEAVMEPLEDIAYQISKSWGCFEQMNSIMTSDASRALEEEYQGHFVDLQLKIGQNEKIYNLIKDLPSSSEWKKMSSAKQRTITHMLKSMKHSGVGLEGEAKENFNKLSQRLSELSTKFRNNTVDAEKDMAYLTNDLSLFKGLSPSWKENASLKAKKLKGVESTPENGPWLITFDVPTRIQIMEYAQNRDFRKTYLEKSAQMAYQGSFDNTPIIQEVVQIEHQLAQICGYQNYAEKSLATKMAQNVNNVWKMYEDLLKFSDQKSTEEFKELEVMAQKDGISKFEHFDTYYYARLYKEEKVSYKEEEVKPYFPYENVLQGMLTFTETLFSVKFVDATSKIKSWATGVSYYEMYDAQSQKLIASCFFDPYLRTGQKRSGAWMNVCRPRWKTSQGFESLPVAFLTLNISEPTQTTPALLTFDEVTTLFHEFGHGLQHMLTTIDENSVAGIAGIEWDAVEVASQFMENWCYTPSVLKQFAKHYQTGEVIPQNYIDTICKLNKTLTGTFVRRQVSLGMTDLQIYTNTESHKNLFEISKNVNKEILKVPTYENSHSLCTFGHIFAGGYAAGYFSYLWAEIMSADVFGIFEEQGVENKEKLTNLGMKLRQTIMGLGGSKHPSEVFEMFAGRQPSVKNYAKQNGFIS